MGKEAAYFGNYGELLAILESKTDKSQSYYWRMSQLSLIEGWEQYLERFPSSGMMRNGLCYRLGRISALPIEEGDGFSLPTPTKSDVDKNSSGGLNRLILTGEKYSKGHKKRKNLPTPTAHMTKESGSPNEYRKGKRSLVSCFMTQEEREVFGRKARLNPHFVQWMMGFPAGWLD